MSFLASQRIRFLTRRLIFEVLKSWASKTLSTLHSHLDMIKGIQEKLRK
jgi:hypothetical protein